MFSTNSRPSAWRRRKLLSRSPGNALAETASPSGSRATRSPSAKPNDGWHVCRASNRARGLELLENEFGRRHLELARPFDVHVRGDSILHDEGEGLAARPHAEF